MTTLDINRKPKSKTNGIYGRSQKIKQETP